MLLINKSYFVLFLFFTSLFVMPKFQFASIGFRFEDAIAIIMALTFIFFSFKKGIPMRSFSIILLVYIGYSFLLSILQIGLNNLDAIYIFYQLKEIQYFVYFYFMFLAISCFKTDFEKIIKLIKFLALLTMVWGLYQVTTGRLTGFYGISAISENAPSQSGAMYLTITLFFIYVATKKSKVKMLDLLYIVVGLLLTFATVSRTSILAISTTLAICLVILVWFKKIKLKWIIVTIVMGLISTPFLSRNVSEQVEKVFMRLSNIDGGANVRTLKWEWLLSYSDTLDLFLGKGKGYVQTLTGGFTLSADSMYVRLILETGYVGLILWSLIIFIILLTALKYLKTYFAESLFIILLTISYLIMSVTHEVFYVALQASLYWSLTGIMIGRIILLSTDKSENIRG